MLEAAVTALPAVVIAILLVNMAQRSVIQPPHEPRSPKRGASLIVAGHVLALLGATLALQRMNAPDWTLLLAAAATLVVGFVLRRHIAVFPMRCVSCGRRLSFSEILFREQHHPPERTDETGPSSSALQSACSACH